MSTQTAPAESAGPVALTRFAETVPPERRILRAAMVKADALMRSLGRPNREQVVTTRPDQLTTLQALDLSNGQTLSDLLTRGAGTLLKTHAKDDRLIEDIYQRALCRRPTATELATARSVGGSPMTNDGIAAPETFDPKRYTPFEVGVPEGRILCTFPSIPTAVDNIRISQGLEHVAQVMDRATLIRSHHVADLGNILHSRHQYHWHTGYVPPQTVACPHIGSWIARARGANNPAIPPFINIGQRLEGIGESEELKAFTTGGFFGSAFGPFNLPFPTDAVAAVRPPKGMTRERFEARQKRFRELVQRSPLAELAGDYHQESMLRAIDNAH